MYHFFHQIKKLIQEVTAATDDRRDKASTDEKGALVNDVLVATTDQDESTTDSTVPCSSSAPCLQRALFDLIEIYQAKGQKNKRLEE